MRNWEPEWREGSRKRQLIVRRDRDGEMKYSLSNLPGGLPCKRYAYVQGQRYRVEHVFHEAKSRLGMAQNQMRVLRGWHHHMAWCYLAMLFLLREQVRTIESIPLLSFRDFTELLDYYLPRRSATEEEVLRQMNQRHRKRQEDIDRRRTRTKRRTSKSNLVKLAKNTHEYWQRERPSAT